MRPYDEALAQLLSDVGSVATAQNATENVSLFDAVGRVLAEDLCSPINVPPKDNSAMDGYALRLQGANAQGQWQVVATRLAGDASELTVNPGEAVRIMTGAEVPDGADTVIMQEDINRDGDVISLNSANGVDDHRVAENIRPVGNDIKEGRVIVSQGTKIDASHLGLIASVGIDQVCVFRRPIVAVISTGDELIEPGSALPAGAIYNSNRYFLLPMLQKLGCEIIDYGTLKDDQALFEKTFKEAADKADFVITTGGVSVGDADYVKPVLEALGNIDFWKVAIKPGKPFACGRLTKDESQQAGYLLGLPGNPVSAIVTFMLLARPAIQQFSGQAVEPLAFLPARVTQDVRKRPGRMDFQRAHYEMGEDGRIHVTPFNSQSSGVLSSIAECNCFMVLDREQGAIDAGAKVKILPFREWL
ncbi:gephyrin-like molybdotransferase Glp [Litoribrevibacter euphylliae]|uniref:Molybdopterin molybdenumtransferase n=1 Tax=Litoribrevibacter euphylliae TaxID=1834034 RepID=A0ABV7HAG9_9GAMM